MKALARLPPAALWFLNLPETINSAIPNAEMNETSMQELVDQLNDVHAVADCSINAMSPIATVPLPDMDNIAVVNCTPSCACQHPEQQQFIPQPVS